MDSKLVLKRAAVPDVCLEHDDALGNAFSWQCLAARSIAQEKFVQLLDIMTSEDWEDSVRASKINGYRMETLGVQYDRIVRSSARPASSRRRVSIEA